MTATAEREERGVDLPTRGSGRGLLAWQQTGVSVLVGGAGGALLALAGVETAYAAIAAWVLAVSVYLVWVWRLSWSLDANGTAHAAVREDPSRALADAALLVAAVASLAAVGFTIADASSAHGVGKAMRVAVGVATVVTSWFLVHTLFTVKYARHYYDGDDGGIDFNTDQPPIWSDFAYFSFTIGMTFQVSDTDVKDPGLRRLALRHMLLSYLFGAVIVAVTINLIAGLAK